MSNVIQEYLVKLGFEPDRPALRKLETALEDAERSVQRHSSGILKWVLAVPAGIVSTFVSISAAAVTLADKVAMADQSYRLMGLRMLMTTESARKMDLITKALGADMQDIVWDPELHQRAVMMGEDIDRMTKALGPGFAGGMKGIRDIRYEFSRLEVASKFLGMRFAMDLFQKLAPEGFKGRLQDFVGWFESKIPEFSDKLTNVVIPVMRQTWQMAKAGGQVLKSLGWAFTEVVGYFAKDQSIRGAAFSFEHFSTALGHVMDWVLQLTQKLPDAITWLVTKFEDFVQSLPGIEKRVHDFVAHVIQRFQELRTSIARAMHDAGDGLGHFSGALSLLASGKFAAAGKEFRDAGEAFKRIGADVAGKADKQRPAPAEAKDAAPSAPGAPGKPASTPVLPQKGHLWQWLTSPVPDSLNPGAGTPRWRVPNDRQPSWLEQKLNFRDHIADWLYSFKHGTAAPAKDEPTSAVRPSGQAPAVSLPGVVQREAGEERTAPVLVDALAAAITRYEAGDKKNPISVRNNNPGNLRTWGDYPVVDGFAKFPDFKTGWSALIQLLQSKLSLGLTPRELFAGKEGVYSGYAPKKDRNDPNAYADTVAKWLSIDPDRSLKDANPPADSDVRQWLQNPPKWFNPTGQTIDQSKTRSFADQRDWSESFARWQTAAVPTVPQATNRTVTSRLDVGGIYITQPAADARQIERAVSKAIREAEERQVQFDLVAIPALG